MIKFPGRVLARIPEVMPDCRKSKGYLLTFVYVRQALNSERERGEGRFLPNLDGTDV